MSRRRWLVWTAVVLGAVAVLARFTWLAPEVVPVRAVRAEPGRVESTIANTKAGTIRARRRAQMSSETGGRVVEIAHREGERVEAGASLLRLNDATHRAELTLAQESLRAAEASQNQACIERDHARRDLARARKLAEKSVVSEEVLDGLATAYEVASAACTAVGAEVSKARARIAVVEAELEKLTLRAPFDGVIAEVAVEVGEWITPSPPLLVAPPVIDLIDPSSLYVSAPMDEVDSAAVEAGQIARVTVDSHPGAEFAGRVVRVAPYVLDVEAQNRTVEIEVELDDRQFSSKLLPGTSADVEVILEVREDVLRVPASALLEGDRVLLVEDGTLTERSVEVGIKNWDYAEVREGLRADALVVVSLDRAEVKAGARVRVEETDGRP
ncbi:MAG: efflux RND transporter periplasmic adaptor subunit [Deltaproteobacteria bacterium]|nr:MAG: efflux RND transporter periplasmic adaptor subunit [Deltaproteobacteria bacterium]